MDTKRTELIEIANELNKELKLDPLINLKASKEELWAKLKEASNLVTVDDTLSEKTWGVVKKFWAEREKEEDEEI